MLQEVQNALRFARRFGRRHGIVVARFVRVHPLESESGGEWLGCDYRGQGYVTAWRTCGARDEATAEQTQRTGINCAARRFDGVLWSFLARPAR